MKILRIERKQETEEENYTLITFKTFWGRVFTETCVTPMDSSYTGYAKNGDWLGVPLWDTVKSFLRTGDEVHDYEKVEK